MKNPQARIILIMISVLMAVQIVGLWLPLLTQNASTGRQHNLRDTDVALPGAPMLAELAANHGYRLAPGQAVRRIAPPFPDARTTYYKVGHADQAHAIKDPPGSMVFNWDGRQLRNWGMSFGNGFTLQSITEILMKTNGPAIEGPVDLLNQQLSGDWIFNPDSAEDDILEQFKTILVKDCQLPIDLRFAALVRPVYVASGRFDSALLEKSASASSGQTSHRINVYDKSMTTAGGGGSGDYKEFFNKLGSWINTTVEDEIVGPPESTRFTWHFYFNDETFQRPDRESADETLQNITRQTGLIFKKELRSVRRLVVEPIEPDTRQH